MVVERFKNDSVNHYDFKGHIVKSRKNDSGSIEITKIFNFVLHSGIQFIRYE